MKKLCVVLAGMCSLLFWSCNNDSVDIKDEKAFGIWADNIKLSKKNVLFDAASNSVTISAVGESWWVINVSLNGEFFDISTIDQSDRKFTFNNPEFKIERKNKKTIVIEMSKNTTGSERILNVGLEAGDYFDVIQIKQAK